VVRKYAIGVGVRLGSLCERGCGMGHGQDRAEQRRGAEGSDLCPGPPESIADGIR
jgi:hypothetical protein